MRTRLLALSLPLFCALTLGQSAARPGKSPEILPVAGARASIEIRHASPAGVLPAAVEPPDTLWFGGTQWSAANSRWEAIPGGTWTFDSGVGSHFVHEAGTCKDTTLHAQMEGWTGLDLTAPDPEASFRRLGVADFSGAACVGSPAGLSGDYSFWVGLLQFEAEELCWVGGQGYGNSWSVCLEKTFAHDGVDSLRLEYGYVTDLEPGFDYAYVYCDTSGAGDDVQVVKYNGIASGTAQHVLTAGVDLRSDPGPTTIKFCFMSDGAYSDEDGLYLTSCSGLALDDILVSNLAAGGTVYDFSDFETDEGGWRSVDPYPCSSAGDFADLAHLDDLPPIPGGLQPCSVDDSVLVLTDSSPYFHPDNQSNVAVSPWIDLEAGEATGFPTKFVEYGGYFDLPLQNYVFTLVMAQWYPDTCAYTGEALVSELQSTGFVYYYGGVPTCEFKRQDLSELIPPHATRVRIALGVQSYCYYYGNCTGVTNITPIFDNVRFGTVDLPYISTLQAAIDAASPGDTILVGARTYSGTDNRNLDFGGKNLVMIGVGGPEATIIDCQGAGRAFVFDDGEDTTSVVEGFTIRNGFVESGNSGGAVLVSGNSGVTFRDCVFEDNGTEYGSGGALALTDDARVIAEACRFTGNDAVGSGGAISALAPCILTLDSCEVFENTASLGGGLYLQTRSPGTEITDCLISRNTAANQVGAAIYCSGEVRVTNSTISENIGFSAIGGWGTISGGAIRDNTGDGVGGRYDVSDCLVEGNGGRGLDLELATVLNCLIRNNAEGGLRMSCSEAIGCTVVGNSAPRGGGIEIHPLNDFPLLCWVSSIDSCLVAGNSAEEGGGVYTTTYIGPYHGGDVRGFISRSTIAGNRAKAGGGIGALLDTEDSLLDLDRVALWGNHADSLGHDLWFIDTTAVVTVTCSAIDTTGIAGDAPVHFIGPQVHDYPLFCAPEPWYNAPTTAGDYTLASGSPCLPENSPCDSLIGALGQGCGALGIPDEKPPVSRAVLSAWPNPAQSAVQIAFAVPGDGAARIEIFDVAGRLVRRLDAAVNAGSVSWDRRSNTGARAPSGIYFLRLVGDTESVSRRLVLID